MTALSKATQLLIPVAHCFQEYDGDPPTRILVATVIEALVDQLAPQENHSPNSSDIVMETCRWDKRQGLRQEALSIAAELRNPHK